MKKPPRTYDFNERLDFSSGHAPDPDSVFPFLKSRIPGFKGVRKASKKNDQGGCDYFIERYGLFTLQMDAKVRGEDYSLKLDESGKPLDDLALETFSVIEKGIIGWTRDATKSTDYVMWFWKDTGRFFIVPFPPLCCVFQRYWKQWREQYKTSPQRSEWGRSSWHSECVFVPRSVVVEYINRWSNGHAAKQAAS